MQLIINVPDGLSPADQMKLQAALTRLATNCSPDGLRVYGAVAEQNGKKKMHELSAKMLKNKHLLKIKASGINPPST